MGLRFVYDPKQDDAPTLEILRRMRDLFITDVRSALLSGIFKDNPEDLEVIGTVEAGVITIVVRDVKGARELTERMTDRLFKKAKEEKAAGEYKDDGVTDGDLTLPGPEDVIDDKPLTGKSHLFKQVSEDEFRNVERQGEITDEMSARIKSKAMEFVSQYIRAKAESIRA